MEEFIIKANWLPRAIALANSSEKFWVKGSIYRGNSPLAEFQQNHINGNAFYASGDRDFQRFVREVWQPFVLENTKNIDPKWNFMILPIIYLLKVSKNYSVSRISEVHFTSASCLLPPASCLVPRASCLVPPASKLIMCVSHLFKNGNTINMIILDFLFVVKLIELKLRVSR